MYFTDRVELFNNILSFFNRIEVVAYSINHIKQLTEGMLTLCKTC